jgi:diguanylate cyclase (GGDEF)-like protein/PAS domain S-box-containing protein
VLYKQKAEKNCFAISAQVYIISVLCQGSLILSLSFNPYSIPVIAAVVLCIMLAVYLKRQKKTFAANHLFILLLLIVLWCTAYSLELNFTEKATKLAAEQIKYIAITLIPVFFLLFVLRYAHPSPRKLPAAMFLLFLPPAAFLALMFTNGLHGLMYTGAYISHVDNFAYTFLCPQYGIAMRLSSVYSYAVLFAALVCIIYVSLKTTRLVSAQALMLVFAVIVPIFTNAMYYLKGFAESYMDYTPITLLFSAALLTYLETGTSQFYLQPLVRDMIIQKTQDSIILLDSENRILDINPITESIFSVKKDEVLGKDSSALSGAFASLIDKKSRHSELQIGRRFYSLSAVALSSDSGAYLGQMVSVKDITEAKRSQKKIRELAFIDPLTKLPNYMSMMQELEEQLQLKEGPVTVLLVDPGKMDHINSSYGYETGDQLIRKTAELIRRYITEADIFARMKGDEFAVIRPYGVPGSAVFIAEHIIQAFQQPLMIQDKFISTSVSIGICTSNAAGEDANVLIHKASLALGQAKKTREHFAFYSEQNEHEITKRNRMLNALRTALNNREFSLAYQPQYDIVEHRLCGVEALLRWTHPEFGSVPPDQFINLLEDSGMIIPVGNWVIEESARQYKEWTDKGIDLPKLSINLSVRQFDNSFLVPYILQTLDSKKIPRHCLEVEVTETLAAITDHAVVSKILELSNAGIRIAIDDFGSGFSSLTYFKYLNVNTLKIDREISFDIHKNVYSSAIFESLKLMCDELGVDIIVEYAETAEQVKKLCSLGCKNFQGFYFSKPLTPEKFERYAEYISSDIHSDELFDSPGVGATP